MVVEYLRNRRILSQIRNEQVEQQRRHWEIKAREVGISVFEQLGEKGRSLAWDGVGYYFKSRLRYFRKVNLQALTAVSDSSFNLHCSGNLPPRDYPATLFQINFQKPNKTFLSLYLAAENVKAKLPHILPFLAEVEGFKLLFIQPGLYLETVVGYLGRLDKRLVDCKLDVPGNTYRGGALNFLNLDYWGGGLIFPCKMRMQFTAFPNLNIGVGGKELMTLVSHPNAARKIQ